MCDCDKKKDLPDICSDCFTDTDTSNPPNIEIKTLKCSYCHSNIILNSCMTCVDCGVVWCSNCYYEKDNAYHCEACFTVWCDTCYGNTDDTIYCVGCDKMWCLKCNESDDVNIKYLLCVSCTQVGK
jgi:hypothetical protein